MTAAGTAVLESRADTLDDDFDLDVRVVVAYASPGRGDCPTNDGCGSTCSTNNSACVSEVGL